MTAYITRRLLLLIPILWGVVTITFLLSRVAPGDPLSMLSGQRELTPERRAQLEHELGLDRPLWKQYFDYLGSVAMGDLGYSMVHNRSVTSLVFEFFPRTLILAASAMVVAVILGITAGLVSALMPDSLYDRIAMVLALLGISTPVFWLGQILILIVAVHYNLLPPSGYGGWKFLVLPAVALGTQSVAFLARMTRASMLEVLGEDYLRTARAKGCKPWVVIVRHGFSNALIPIVTVVGLDFASYLSGSVLTEKVFSWPGLGRFLVDAIAQRDYAVISGVVIFCAMFFVLINLIVDILYAWLDPRIKYA